MIHLDTSVLVDALTGPCRSAPALRSLVDAGERVGISTIVLFEWLRGPRREPELGAQAALLPSESAVPFGPKAAARAAQLYGSVRAARGRDIDLAIAACALEDGARLWTLNIDDFKDIVGLTLYHPASAGGPSRRGRALKT